MTTSFNAAAAPTPAPAAPVTPAPASPEPTSFEFEYGGRKFTREELVTKLTHADNHIATLTNERAGDRQALQEAAAQLQAAVKAAELLKAPAPAAPAAAPAAAAPTQDIESLVLRTVEARDIKAREDSNWKAAQDAMTKAYGEKADEKAAATAKELGMTVNGLVQLARTSPAAFTRLFPELSASSSPASSPSSGAGVNTAAVKTDGAAPVKSGYWEAKNAKEQVSAYTKRLKELSGA